MQISNFFSRDISWLSFNQRVLAEAGRDTVPLAERVKFLSIYSSNLDEFYRVRMPALMALQKINKSKADQEMIYTGALEEAKGIIHRQQELFGKTIGSIIPLLEQHHIRLLYNQPIPQEILPGLTEYFFTQVLAFIQPVYLADIRPDFFPGNNKLYIVAALQYPGKGADYAIINIPSDTLPRFKACTLNGTTYIVFLEDIIKHHLPYVFRQATLAGAWNFKITRDAELNLEDDFEEDMAEKIEKQIMKRDYGFATRFLYQPGIPAPCLESMITHFGLTNASIVAGGTYHNLKDLAALPINKGGSPSKGGSPASVPEYEPWPAIMHIEADKTRSLFEAIAAKDLIIHAPYQSYNTVLRFFNEAAIDPAVSEIYATLYRVADDSKIVHALISAARNGKQVTVLVELKARFDEANNIRWARQMKAAGVKIIYSEPALKVHAKIALVKRKDKIGTYYAGLLATGNLNESTARFYTDHILLTSDYAMLSEMEQLFVWLSQRKKTGNANIKFRHLLAARFNLQRAFMDMIDREIAWARQGKPAKIIIKLNNLEEKKLISKLYEASQAGVIIQLLVRGICCLMPGVPGISENITVRRIVDRYLEHGRVFIFLNGGQEEIYLGSADWMDRNIYRRIEVCFPVYDKELLQEIKDIISLQLRDTVQAVQLDSRLQNQPVAAAEENIRSQEAIYQYLKNKATNQVTIS
ncbi:polyphosphate kinase 1 [Paraflavitalea soli]|uniref:Polyphosphate kinase n=1 Tax=Paraflavitalea soli TaxID=2315862 RepID=A0A3B7MVX7_9BACT|nr:polyphosphate kinase 1 [Paraflavitalea soli]AXY77359.1 polyphosphate kinase 1 [Paraflavitalea soli]